MVDSQQAETTEQIRRASDIVEVVSACVNLKRAGRNLRGLCPFHSEKTPSFHVLPDRQTFKCFGCGAGGDVFKFIQLRESVGFVEARTILASRAGINLETDRRSPGQPSGLSKPDLERVNRWAEQWFRRQLASPVAQRARTYVTQRGISLEMVERFGLGFAPDSWDAFAQAAAAERLPLPMLLAAGFLKQRDDGRPYDAFRNRLMFPIRDALGRVVAFGGRTLGDDPAKYLNSPQTLLFDKSRSLYAIELAKEAFRTDRRAVIVEGYIDCLMAHQHGFPNVVATLGTALTGEHVQALSRYVDEVVLLFDSDAAGQRAAENSLPAFMLSRLDVRLGYVPEGKDPADLLQTKGAEAFRSVLTSTLPALEYKWRQVRRRYESDTAGPSQRRAVEEFLSLVVQSSGFGSCDPIQRGLIINRVGKLLGLSAEEVNRQLRIVARRSAPATGAPGGSPARASLPSDPAAVAMRQLLEVLLNAPEHYAICREEFAPDHLLSEEDRAIARAIAAMIEQDQTINLPALISRFESVRTAERIMELQTSGEQRGNYQATVEGSLARLQTVREQQRISAEWARLREDGPPPEASPEQDSSAPARDEHVIERPGDILSGPGAIPHVSHFAARRHRAAPLTAGAQPAGPPLAG